MPQPLSISRILLYGVLCALLVEIGVWLLFRTHDVDWSALRIAVMCVAGLAAFAGGALIEVKAHTKAVKRFESYPFGQRLETYRERIQEDNSTEQEGG